MKGTVGVEDALDLMRAGKCKEALGALSELIEFHETCAEALVHRAWHYKSTCQWIKAADDYSAYLELHPNDWHARLYYAEVLFRAGLYREAIHEAVRVLSENPECFEATRLLLGCQEALGLAPEPGNVMEPDPTIPVRPINAVIQALEGETTNYPASVFPEIGRFLYTLVRLVRPRLMLETGTYAGYSSLCIAQAMQDNDLGHLHCFDLFLDMGHYHSPVAPGIVDGLELVSTHLEKAGLRNRVSLHKGNSSVKIRETFGDHPEKFDMAFIDGDHTINGCLEDWRAVDELLAEGGIVILHDTKPERCGWLGPRYLLESLDERANGDYYVLNLPSPEGFGLGLLQKKTAKKSGAWKPSFVELAREVVHLYSNPHNHGVLKFVKRALEKQGDG